MIKKLLTLVFLLPAYIVFGQDTTYYDIDKNIANPKQDAQFYSVVIYDTGVIQQIIENTYYQSGQLYRQANYSDYVKKVLYGELKSWYENGQLKSEVYYKNNKREGKLLAYWSNGKIKREEEYQNGEFLKGKCFDSTGREIPYFLYMPKAKFPGGDDKINEYLSNAIIYPSEAKKNKETGKVIISFIIDRDGGIKNVEVEKGVSKALDKEAIRIIQQMPRWIPAYSIDENAIETFYSLIINFQLNE